MSIEEPRAAEQNPPTAAAAVPAGGDAVAWNAYTALRWIADRYSDRKSTSECASDAYEMACVARAALVTLKGDAVLELCNAADDVGVNHFDTDDMPADVERMQQATIAVRKTLAAPAPRGGVTEASAGFVEKALVTFAATDGPDELMQVSSIFLHRLCQITIQHAEQKLAEYDASKTTPAVQAQDAEQKRAWQEFKRQWDDVPEALKSLVPWPLTDSLQTLGRAMETQPAGDAQDAGPMARHFVAAIKDIRDETRNSPNCDIEIVLSQVEQRARALAAKEAK